MAEKKKNPERDKIIAKLEEMGATFKKTYSIAKLSEILLTCEKVSFETPVTVSPSVQDSEVEEGQGLVQVRTESTDREVFETVAKGDYVILLGTRVLFDSVASRARPVFEEEYFILFGRKYPYAGTRIRKK